MKKQTIDLDKKVIGLELDDCFVCGKGDSTRHHAIAKELKPKRNVTLLLCDEHKNSTHHVIKQFTEVRKKHNLNRLKR